MGVGGVREDGGLRMGYRSYDCRGDEEDNFFRIRKRLFVSLPPGRRDEKAAGFW
jgi:hypothetical protein